ncbi:MAG: glycosyltransferase family 4 protein [Actinobacteria bacterium]|nr:glycosyltransferase family 4 protein [Actinomycetota bacterium]
MGRIKVMHVIRPSQGGIRNHLLTLVGESDRNRFEHMVACPEGMAGQFAQRVKTYPLPLEGDISLAGDLAAAKKLFCLFRDCRVDIVHAHGSKAGLVGRPAALLAGVPAVVMTVHNSIFHHHLPGWKVSLFAASERFLAGYTARIIAVSEALRRELIDREGVRPERVVTVYNGIAPEAFCSGPDREYLERVTGIPAGRKLVGTVARLAPQKGLKYLLNAASLLSARGEELSFVIVGDGPLRKELEKEVSDLDLPGRVFFTGQRRDVDRLMPCFDVFVLPSVSEGLPLTILEAMAAGRPVVSTRVGGIPEVIEEGVSGLLVDPGDIEGLARAIAYIAGDEEIARRMGGQGRERVVKHFNSRKMAGDTDSIYNGLAYGGIKFFNNRG